MPEYPAITLWQPWACLIEIGAKPFETRSWKPPAKYIGQRIAIHAAARPCVTDLPQELLDAITDAFGRCAWNHWLPRGAIVCTAVLADAVRVERVPHDPFGDYSPGRWAWKLQDVEPVRPHVPAKGAQGFWTWTATSPPQQP